MQHKDTKSIPTKRILNVEWNYQTTTKKFTKTFKACVHKPITAIDHCAHVNYVLQPILKRNYEMCKFVSIDATNSRNNDKKESERMKSETDRHR